MPTARPLAHFSFRLAGVVLALLASISAARAQSMDWKILKPTNTGIPGDNTYDIYIDGSDRPWIPGFHPFHQEGGVGIWDEATDTWSVISNVDYPVISSPRFNDMDADASGTVWIATDEGLLRYDPELGPDSLQRFDASNSPMPNNWVRMISIAPDDSVWLAISNSSGPFGGLVRFDPATNQWDVWTTANGLPWGTQWPGWDWIDYVAAAPDDDGGYTVYFGSMEMGAASYKGGVFQSFVSDPPATGPVIWGLPSDDPVDDLGHTWLNSNQGLVRRDPDGSLTVVALPPGGSGRLEAFDGGHAGLASMNGDVWTFDGASWTSLGNWGASSTYAIAREQSGEVWVGGAAGAARYVDGSWQRYRLTNTGMLGHSIQAIDFDAAGNVTMNGNAGPGVGGFCIYDGERWTSCNNLNYGLGPVWGQPSDDVDVLATRASGGLALDVGVQGLQTWDGSNYSSLNPLYNTDAVAEDGLGRVWSGTWGRLFLYEHGQTTEFNTVNSPMFNFIVRAVVRDELSAGFVWAATGTGVVHTDGVTWGAWPTGMLGLDNESIQDISPASDGTLWIGSSGGAVHFDPVTLAYETFTKTNTAMPSNAAMRITAAPDGSAWVSTFDDLFPYPGGLTQLRSDGSTTWTATNSPLPHNQHWELTSRGIPGGYEVWVGTASAGIAVVSVMTPPGETCQEDLGFGGPGNATLNVCGGDLSTGTTANLLLSGTPPNATCWLVASTGFAPTAFKGGQLVPVPIQLTTPFVASATGQVSIADIPGGGGPLDVFVQFAIEDAAQPAGFGLSNAVRMELLP